MSIINKVLNDIEEQSKIEKKPALGSLEPIYIKELDSSKYLYLVIGMLSAVILGLLWWLFSPMELKTNSENKTQASIVAKPSEIQSITAERSSKEVIPKQLISKKTALKPIAPKIVAPKTIPPESIESKQVTLQKKVVEVADSNDTFFDNTVLDNAESKEVEEIVDNEKTVTKKDINVKKSLSITPVKMSNIAVANLKLKQGIKAQQNGDIIKAQKMWQEALTIKPDLHDARIQLAASFYGANELSQALSVMSKAVGQFPQYDGYRLMAAQIYYQEKQPEKALSVLNSPFNKIDVATENLVLAGSLAQQLQQWPAAQSNYKVLVNRDINNSQWILGLAIAYDALGEKENAHRYYSRLMSLGNVDQAIREYARKRSSILKTSMNTRGYNG